MCLGFQHGHKTYNKHLVVHEFGHALGLHHEHQRSCFSHYANLYLDVNKMVKDLKLTENEIQERYLNTVDGIEDQDNYDSSSAMHYW